MMCSYCGCRNNPMIAKLNAEHDAIVNASHRLQTAVRDDDPDLAREGAEKVSILLRARVLSRWCRLDRPRY